MPFTVTTCGLRHARRLLALIVLCLAPRALEARPVHFPESAAGYPGETRDERDVAPYLSYHQAHAMARAGAMETVTTPNQDAWDARFYSLDLTMTPSNSTVSGTVQVRAQVVTGPLSVLQLDLYSNMIVSAATSGGFATTWSHNASDLLTVNLDRAYLNGETVTVTVTYQGVPFGGSLNFNTWNGQPMIWSLSEPFGARSWWPCKDYPSDKADSVDVRITVPTGLITASNGTRVMATDNGSLAVSKWQERHPIATYLVSVAIHPYTVSNDFFVYAPGDTMPITFFNFPDHVAQAAPTNAKVKNMLSVYETRFGPYPFRDEKYGHAEFLWGGGMEHQTCSSMGTFLEYIVAHELGHQWWGDLVTCRSFNHIWLNEGFATYAEALWAESLGGAEAYRADLAFNEYYGPGTIYVVDETNETAVFSSNLSYNKGSWVLHMLRGVLGDTVFFEALEAYRAAFAYSSATTEDFQAACEQASGRDLDWFFQEWIYGEYYPAYKYSYSSVPAGGGYDVTLTVEQTQSWQIFRMPVDVTVTTTAGAASFTIDDSLAWQQFVLHVDAEPVALELDPDGWILKTIESPVTAPQFDRGILVVNGVSWNDYGAEITSAYNDEAFWGDYPIHFWDHFAAPAGGYPGTLPAPLGHGPVPPEVMGHYRNVIWVGNNFGGDLGSWYSSPIQSYLESGGNVLLLARMGDSFLTEPLRNYLGINWVAGTSITDCVAAYPGLTSIPRIGTQNTVPVFDMALTQPDSYLLYRAEAGYTPDRGIGVYRRPAAGGTHRYNGGRFIFLSGRPYRWNHAALESNVMYMLQNFFLEPLDVADAGDGPITTPRVHLAPPSPNPFASTTALRFDLPRNQEAEMVLLDVSGRQVRKLFEGHLSEGPHEFIWDGRDGSGRLVAGGVYWARLKSGEAVLTRKVTVVR